MKANILCVLLSCLSFSCSSQGEQADKIVTTEDNKKELTEPKGSWRVNKEYDADGNIIKFDSIYTWSSSTMPRDLDSDSIFKEMQSMMQKRFSMRSPSGIHGFEANDSINSQFVPRAFFEDDFFSDGSPFGGFQRDAMMERMEAIRRQFFNDQSRYIIPPERESFEKRPSKEPSNQKV